MKIFIASIATETNTFSPIPTGMDSYEDAMVAHGDATSHPLEPFTAPLHIWKRNAEEKGWSVVESLTAHAQPGGATVRPVYEAFRTEVLEDPPQVRGLGFVSDERLEALLASACCLVSSSAAEGFGLPVLAALSAGIPVVATREPALEEVAGDAAHWLAPEDLGGLVERAAAIAAGEADVAGGIARGRERARAYSAARAACELARVLGQES